MRRADKQTTQEEATTILKNNNHGILSMISPENEPYAIPINYAFFKDENILVLHGSNEGFKIKCLEHCNKAHFTVIGKNEIEKAELTTYYESVLCKGTVKILTKHKEYAQYLTKMTLQIIPETLQKKIDDELEKNQNTVAVLVFKIEAITGKANKANQ